MFSRSTWFLTLFALLGVFSFSAQSQEYFSTATNTQTGDVYYFEYGYAVNNPAGVCYSLGYSIGVSSNGQARCIQEQGSPSVYYDLDNINGGSVPANILYPPFDENGECYFGSPSPECVVDGDTDGDGIPNALDEDSRAYDPDFCTNNPGHAICTDDSGGGDTGGGDTGGGDTGGGDTGGGGSGGGLPSSCEGSPTFSESCCFDHAEAQCLDEGGLYDWGYVSVGTPACNFTCNDTVNPPDNGGGDGSGGDSGGSGDGGSGSDDTPTDDTDVISAVNALQTANQTEFNAIQDDLNALTTTNQQGFNDVRAAIENIQVEGLTKSDLSDLENNTANTANNLNSLRSDVNSNSANEQQLLSDVNSSINSLNSDLNYIANQPFDGANFESQLQGAGTPDDIIIAGMGDFETATGIDKDGELETTVVDLGEEINKYDPMLGGSSSECPADYSLTVAGAQYSISWTPVCDAFGILSIFVQAAAWFAVPFIVLGVGKK